MVDAMAQAMAQDRMVKVICFYSGPRRVRNNNPQGAGVAAVHDAQAEIERINRGYSVVGVFNGGNAMPAFAEGHWFSYTRENEGGSFGAYADAYDKMGEFFDFWMLQEDDILVTEPGVFAEAVAYLKAHPKVGFVALSPISESPCRHAGGAFGVARRETLADVASRNGGRLPVARSNHYPDLEQGEVEFTNAMVRAGWEIHNLPGVSPFAENWKTHESQADMAVKVKVEGRYVYRIGL
jgi:hypothetical protein